MTGIPWQSGASRLKDTIRKTKFRKQKQTDENLSLQHLEHFQQKCEAVLRRKCDGKILRAIPVTLF
jgi:homoserine trans-succinylase